MKARIPKHREFIIDFPQDMDQAKANEGWNKLNEIVEEYKKLRRKKRKSFLHGTAKEIGMKHFPCRNLGNTPEERNNHGYQSIGTAASRVYGARI